MRVRCRHVPEVGRAETAGPRPSAGRRAQLRCAEDAAPPAGDWSSGLSSETGMRWTPAHGPGVLPIGQAVLGRLSRPRGWMHREPCRDPVTQEQGPGRSPPGEHGRAYSSLVSGAAVSFLTPPGIRAVHTAGAGRVHLDAPLGRNRASPERQRPSCLAVGGVDPRGTLLGFGPGLTARLGGFGRVTAPPWASVSPLQNGGNSSS